MVLARVCRLSRYPEVASPELRGGAVAIGNFDGVHLGHEQVVRVLLEASGGHSSTVVSFYPHPLRILGRANDVPVITSVREKRARLGQLGVDALYLIHFTSRLAQMSAEEFIEQVLVRALGARTLVMGQDGALGRAREGDLTYLRAKLPEYGIALQVVPTLEIGGVRPGSRSIRSSIGRGDVQGAASLLGRSFSISACVGHGDKRGGALGFPTMNLVVGKRLIPARGVYACRVRIGHAEYKAVANIGTRPTFSGLGERLEVHVLDHDPGSMYGRRIEVFFLERLRDERRFASVEELKTQIALDVAQARVLLDQQRVV